MKPALTLALFLRPTSGSGISYLGNNGSRLIVSAEHEDVVYDLTLCYKFSDLLQKRDCDI